MSHTVKVKVELKDRVALARVIVAMGGRVLGEGTHSLFAAAEQGFGFTLPGWQFPLVLKDNGELAFDDYKGAWGKVSDLDRLKDRYALSVARAAAEAQGWLCEEAPAGLTIYHPDGGTLTVRPDGTVDAAGFEGCGCTNATEAIERAMGSRQEEHIKDEYFAERARINATE
jgi:hypothetical protein